MDKENLILIAIVTLFVSLFVGLTYSQVTKYYATGKIALKTASAKDIALIIDAIYASPYNLELEYNYDLTDFVVEISNNRVRLYGTSFVRVNNGIVQGDDPFFAQYSFVTINDNPEFLFDKPNRLKFTKTNGKLTITT